MVGGYQTPHIDDDTRLDRNYQPSIDGESATSPSTRVSDTDLYTAEQEDMGSEDITDFCLDFLTLTDGANPLLPQLKHLFKSIQTEPDGDPSIETAKERESIVTMTERNARSIISHLESVEMEQTDERHEEKMSLRNEILRYLDFRAGNPFALDEEKRSK